ncbi:MAG: SDR family NAD(P)-dependent oxidoreductase [Novosphingobium sp.]|nr:SDR family NAD(P)-dependent oxidoreductase [Novosphingobium sp.]
MLEGKVVAITGGGRGIGRAVALACAAEGAAVIVNDPGVSQAGKGGDDAPADSVVREIVDSGGQAFTNQASVADPVGAQSIVDDAIGQFGRIDAVVNTAGILRDAIWHKLSLEDWRAVIDVHLNGTFNVSKAATPYFREQKSGSFIHFTSGAGLIGNVGQANYSAAKLGIVGLSQSIALDAARYGVRSNCIAPIAFTRMIASLMPDDMPQDHPALQKYQAMGPDRIAPLAVFLASDAARDVTNQIFGVRGNEISLFSKPRPVRSVSRAQRWTAQAIAEELMPEIAPDMPRADEVAADVFPASD